MQFLQLGRELTSVVLCGTNCQATRLRRRSTPWGERRVAPPCAKSWPAELAEQFGGLLWGNLLVSLLLGVANRPNSHEILARARDAMAAFLQLHPGAQLLTGVID